MYSIYYGLCNRVTQPTTLLQERGISSHDGPIGLTSDLPYGHGDHVAGLTDFADRISCG